MSETTQLSKPISTEPVKPEWPYSPAVLSERIKAGMEKARKQGKSLARGKDKTPRRKDGYLDRWAKERAKRRETIVQ